MCGRLGEGLSGRAFRLGGGQLKRRINPYLNLTHPSLQVVSDPDASSIQIVSAAFKLGHCVNEQLPLESDCLEKQHLKSLPDGLVLESLDFDKKKVYICITRLTYTSSYIINNSRLLDYHTSYIYYDIKIIIFYHQQQQQQQQINIIT